jgi:hypothetical protein
MTHEDMAGYLVALAWHTRLLSYLMLATALFMVVGMVAILRDTRAIQASVERIAQMTADVLRRTP